MTHAPVSGVVRKFRISSVRDTWAMNSQPIHLVGVPFDSYARTGGVADAAGVLRMEGLAGALWSEVQDLGDLDVPAPIHRRAEVSGLLNEAALLALVRSARTAVSRSIDAGAFSVLAGGDCAVLIGALAGLRDSLGEVGLLFVNSTKMPIRWRHLQTGKRLTAKSPSPWA